MNVPDNVLARIKKLLSLSESSNEHEAAAAAARAQELMFRYDLEMSTVAGFDLDPDNKVDEHNFELGAGESKVPKWRDILFAAVARTSMCKPYLHRSDRSEYGKRAKVYGRIIGRKADVEVAQYTFTWLTYELERLSHAYMASQIYWDAADSRRMRRSWLEGATSGVVKQLNSEFDSRKSETEQTYGLVVTREREIDDWLSESDLKLRSRKVQRSRQDTKAFAAGFQTGSTMPMRKGVGTGASAPRIGRG